MSIITTINQARFLGAHFFSIVILILHFLNALKACIRQIFCSVKNAMFLFFYVSILVWGLDGLLQIHRAM